MNGETTVSRDGIVTRGDRRLGWVDRYRQKSGKWRAIREGGVERGGFPSRREAVAWLETPR